MENDLDNQQENVTPPATSMTNVPQNNVSLASSDQSKIPVWKTVLTILFIILIPPLGIVFTWLWTTWPKVVKWVITLIDTVTTVVFIIVLIPTLIIMVGITNINNKAKVFQKQIAEQSKEYFASTMSIYIELYYQDKTTFPQTNSFAQMVQIIKSFNESNYNKESLDKLYKDINLYNESKSDYSYRYCSTNGTDYIIQTYKRPSELIESRGYDNCIPKE